MTVKTFFYGISASFGIAWLIMLAVTYGEMRSLKPVEFDEVNDGKTGLYQPLRSGRVGIGSKIYAQEGCTMCHTQLTRPTYAGTDVFREGQGGFSNDPERGDTRRITNPWDFSGEDIANIGEARIGPDLGNFGRRMDLLAAKSDAEMAKKLGVDVDKLGDKAFNKELYVYKHLYNPTKFLAELYPHKNGKTNCPSNSRFFKAIGNYGQGSDLVVDVVDDKQIVPSDRGRAVMSYLLSLKRDGNVPYSMQYKRDKKPAGK